MSLPPFSKAGHQRWTGLTVEGEQLEIGAVGERDQRIVRSSMAPAGDDGEAQPLVALVARSRSRTAMTR
jgi:hypothetical protein